MAKQGRRVKFHGAFGSKAKAVAKEKKVQGGFIKQIKVRGRPRWVVMSERKR